MAAELTQVNGRAQRWRFATGLLRVVLFPPPRHPARVLAAASGALWWALAGALACAAGWTVIAMTTPVTADGTTSLLWPAGAAATLAVLAGAAATTPSRSSGIQAGLLTAVLGALARFALDLTAILQAHHYTLTSASDIAAYAHSGYPSVASYVLSDAVAGDILGGLVLYPIALLVVAFLGAAAGAGLRQLAVRRTSA